MNSGTVIAVASILAVLVTAVYAFFTWRLWQETRRQAATTQRMLEASQRPYVSIDVSMGAGTSPRLIRLQFLLQNHGSVPAVVIGWDFTLRDRQDALGHETSGTPSEFSLCLFPGRDATIKRDFEDVEATRIWGTRTTVWVDMTLKYRGQFENLYTTGVTARLTNPGGTLANDSMRYVQTERHEVV